MPNNGHSSPSNRYNPDGPTNTSRRSQASDPTGVEFADVHCVLRAETRAGQYTRGGWDKYEVPMTNDGDATVGTDGLPAEFARGGNADQHLSADYPGGTVA